MAKKMMTCCANKASSQAPTAACVVAIISSNPISLIIIDMTGPIRRGRRFPYLFQVASLRFGVHGIGGILSVLLTEVCRSRQQPSPRSDDDDTSPSFGDLLLLISSQVLDFALVYHANGLLPQVPSQTAIVPWIVAPHREAFRRTIGMMQYLVVRILCRVLCQRLRNIDTTLALVGTCACLAVPYARLVPWTLLRGSPDNRRQHLLGNGNTWIFVLPIWLGTTGDLWQMIRWGDVISVRQLLQVELVGLGLAFGFTLAFRNVVPMWLVYFVAAWRVWEILREGVVTVRAG